MENRKFQDTELAAASGGNVEKEPCPKNYDRCTLDNCLGCRYIAIEEMSSGRSKNICTLGYGYYIFPSR